MTKNNIKLLKFYQNNLISSRYNSYLNKMTFPHKILNDFQNYFMNSEV